MSPIFVPTSWLFVRNEQSIRIVRPRLNALLICGPEHALARPEFVDDVDLEAFLVDAAAALRGAGWQALGENYDRRRNKTDRRKVARGTKDRRNQDVMD